MNGLPRWIGLPIAALVLVGGLVWVQLSNGGGTYEPLRAADPCAARVVTSRADGIDGLTERLVLIGVNDAACTLGVSREALTLQLAQSGDVTDAQADALRGGLLSAVTTMKDDGSLPPASALADEAIDNANLNGFVERLVRLIPDGVIDAALKTDDILTRAIEGLDVREVLGSINDQNDLNSQIQTAVTQAVKDSLVARLRNLV